MSEKNKIYWAKVQEKAVIPTKRDEDAGYDLFACFDKRFIRLNSLETKLIGLGVASSFDKEYVMILKERGSSGKMGLSLRAGVIDSGFRGEYMACITNVNPRPIYIIKKEALMDLSVQKQIESQKATIYPYEKAICQGVLLKMPEVESEEITYEELQEIASERGDGMLGSSGK